jgi:hypothetical protein
MSGQPITVPEAIAFLRVYQEWRRGEVDHPQPSPLRVGACLDIVLEAAERAQRVSAEAIRAGSND